MAPVPVPIPAHVEAEQDDPRHAKLDREVHGLKAAVTAAPDIAGLRRDRMDRIAAGVPREPDPVQAEILAGLGVLTDFQSLEPCQRVLPVAGPLINPPASVAGVENVRVRREQP